jgi:hypothetical protein
MCRYGCPGGFAQTPSVLEATIVVSMPPNDNLTDDFFSFGLAMFGLDMAVERLDAGDFPTSSTVIEVAWWISAAAQACGHNKDGDILQGFWWVRNKGSHGTALAFDAILRVDMRNPEIDKRVNWGERLWQPLPDHLEGEDGNNAPAAYKDHLQGESVRRTIDEAHTRLAGYFGEATERMLGRST